MNKKKRALALGLAATQLGALSAVVAPLTAFAEVSSPIVTAAASVDQKLGKAEFKTVGDNKYLVYEVYDYSKLPTATGGSHNVLGVKLTAENTDSIAFASTSYEPDDKNDKSGNIKKDGIVLWLPGRKPSIVDMTFRKYELGEGDDAKEITLNNGSFKLGENALTENNAFKEDNTNKFGEETIKIVRVRNLVPTITDGTDKIDTSKLEDGKSVEDAIKGAITVAWGEVGYTDNVTNNQPVLKTDSTKNDSMSTATGYYSVSVETKKDAENTYTVTIALDADDLRLEFADSGLPDGWTVDKDKKTLTKDVTVEVAAEPTVVTAEAAENISKVTVTVAKGTEDAAIIAEVKKNLPSDLTTLVTVKPEDGDSLTKNDYTVAITDGDGKATVEKKDSEVSGVKFTLTVTLGKDSDYTFKSDNDEAAGSTTVEVTVPVEVLTASDITVDSISIAKATPDSMADDETGLAKYQANRTLIADLNKGTIWDSDTKTATVKVPSALMQGENAAGTGGANVCLVMTINSKDITSESFKENINAEDVNDGSKFVDGTANSEKSYVVLWINAHKNALASGTKTVIYKDKEGNAIATVKLVNVPVITADDITISEAVKITKSGDTYDTSAVKTAVEGALGDNSDLVTVTAGTTVTDKDSKKFVTVTIEAGQGKDVVLANDDGKTNKLEIEVEVTVDEEAEPVQVNVAVNETEAAKLTVNGETEEALITAAKAKLTAEVLKGLVTVTSEDENADVSDAIEKVELKTGSTGEAVKDSDGKVTGVKFTAVVTLKSGFVITPANGGTPAVITKEIDITVPGTVKAVPTATVEVTNSIAAAAPATKDDVTLTYKKGTAAFDVATGTVKAGDTLTVTVAAKDGFEFSTDPTVTAKVGSTNATVSGTDGTFTITVPDLPDGDSNKLAITVAGAVKKSATIDFASVSKGDKDPDTMSGDELTRYTANRALYTVTLNENTVKVSAPVGKMKGAPDTGTTGKNALVIVKLTEKVEELKVFKGETEITDRSWYTDGYKFINGASAEDCYVTLWITLTDDRMSGKEKVEYTFKSGKAEKKLTVTFEDTTEYTLTAPAAASEDKYTVEITNPEAGKSEATVTVTPKGDGVITEATVGTTKLTPNGKSYTGKVDIKKLLTSAQIEAGTTEATLVKGTNLTVTVAERSTINATKISAAINAPETMDGTELARYQANRALYEGSIVWDGTSKTATVKVPSKLMTGTAEPGTGAANVCLVMELDGTVEYSSLSSSQFEAVDVSDGRKFVESPADGKTYVVLWISAHSSKFTDGNKIVIYEDNTSKVIATVNLVDVPSLEASDIGAVSKVDLTGVDDAETAIEDAVKAKLGDNAKKVAISVGEIPTEAGDGEVTVTITTKDASALVLGEADGSYKKIAEKLEITVPVNVLAVTKYNIEVTTPQNGTVSFTVDGKASTEAKAGDTVTIVATPSSGYKRGTITVKDADNNTVTVTGTTFTMPDKAVTVTVTFTRISTGTSSSGGSSSGRRPSSGGSSSSTTSTPATPSSEVSSMISSAANGGTVKFNGLIVSSDITTAASKKGLKLEVTVDDTFKWNIDASKITDPSVGLRLTVDTTAVDLAQTAKVERTSGALDKAEMSFTTKADNLGDGATLTILTSVKPGETGMKFANLYKTKTDGTLEFVACAPIAPDGTTVLPIGTAGTYTIIASTETKHPADVNNDCKVDLTDLVAMLNIYANNMGMTRADNFKMDYNNDNQVKLSDLVAVVQDYANGKLN